MATQAQRQHGLHYMKFLLAHEKQVHYPWNDVRTHADDFTFHLTEQAVVRLLEHGGSIQFDCSQSTYQIWRAMGLHIPYKGPGYTGSMLATMRHYENPKVAQIGAACVYGPGTGHHVSLVYEPDPKHGDPLMFSHGREAGPVLVRWSEQRKQQPAGTTFLSIAHL